MQTQQYHQSLYPENSPLEILDKFRKKLINKNKELMLWGYVMEEYYHNALKNEPYTFASLTIQYFTPNSRNSKSWRLVEVHYSSMTTLNCTIGSVEWWKKAQQKPITLKIFGMANGIYTYESNVDSAEALEHTLTSVLFPSSSGSDSDVAINKARAAFNTLYSMLTNQ